MTDLIDRAELIKFLDECLAKCDRPTPMVDAVLTAIKCAVEQMPSVDAVPVVWCKDCKKRNTLNCPMYLSEYSDDFCSCGERKGGDE